VRALLRIERIRELVVQVLSVRENAVSVDLTRAGGGTRSPAHGSEERCRDDCCAQPSDGNDGSDPDSGAPSVFVRGERLRPTQGLRLGPSALRPFSHVPPSARTLAKLCSL